MDVTVESPAVHKKNNAQHGPVSLPAGNAVRGILPDMRSDELPDEPFDEFSTSSFEFESTAKMVWEDTQRIYYHACTANRFSENYLKYCARLEKGIKQVGSLCLTKAALEQKGSDFPALDDMTINALLGMVSYHLLKCHAALNGIYQDNDLLGLSYLGWEYRWLGLGNRLKATEVKIQKIKNGTIKAADLIPDESEPEQKKPVSGNSALKPAKSLHLNARALPLDGSMGRNMLKLEKAKAKEEEKQRREEEFRAAERPYDADSPYPQRGILRKLIDNPVLDLPGHQPKRTEGEAESQEVPATPDAQGRTETETKKEHKKSKELTEEEARNILIDRALKKGDMVTVRVIRQEDTYQLYERWQQYLEEKEAERGRAGPSADTRKKLREKRKKHKK